MLPFLAAAGLTDSAISRAKAVLVDEEIDSVELLRLAWREVEGKFTIGTGCKLSLALGYTDGTSQIPEPMDQSADVGSSSAAASSAIVVLCVEVRLDSQLERLRLEGSLGVAPLHLGRLRRCAGADLLPAPQRRRPPPGLLGKVEPGVERRASSPLALLRQRLVLDPWLRAAAH